MRPGERHLDRPPDMLNREPAGAIVQQPNDVNAYLVKPDPVAGEPAGGPPAQPCPFRPADPLERSALPRAGPGLHLADDERVPLDRDDVDLTVGAPPVAIKDPETATLKVGNSGLLAVPS